MIVRRAAAAFGAVVVLSLPGTAPAAAEPPSRMAAQVVDSVGALHPDDARVRQALEALRARNGTQLFVVYVASFDGRTGQQWADETARLSQLGNDDVLLAVAVTDRAYGYSVGAGSAGSERDVEDLLVRRVEPRLAAGDWSGAVVTLAEGLGASATAGNPGGGVSSALLLGGAVAVGGAGLWWAARRRARRTGAPAEVVGGPGQDQQPGTAAIPTEELAKRASSALIAVDDAVETSEQELAFAQAQFGDEAVTGFRAALDQVRAELRQAFTFRQQLDDTQPETEADRRAMLTEILRLCESADSKLDAQAEAFDRLRALERTAPEALASLTARADACAAGLPGARQRLDELGRRFAASALTPVADNPRQAEDRLNVARVELGEARTALQGDRRGEAVTSIRAAEEAVGQAETLVSSVAQLQEQLEQADARLGALRGEITQDLSEARALARTGGHPHLLADADAAEAALARSEAMVAAAGALPDPLAVLRQLNDAAEALERGLTVAREAHQQRQRSAALLPGALDAATAAVSAAGDFIATRRGAVGVEARTSLAEARRHLEEAVVTSTGEPEAALQHARHADSLARQALSLAQADVDQWSSPIGQPGYGGYSSGIDLGSLVLGGILVGGGSGGGGMGEGWSPGSFGGSGTRSRHGGGGRF
ncbi:TPM domain-containing protein [Actinoplanes sp. NPDC023801]|uniref:TPM domain-containing protein n=1 Tax=Actinoplanes sp. NPDC023801 TaxID=3154595 RepID=UPI0033D98825